MTSPSGGVSLRLYGTPTRAALLATAGAGLVVGMWSGLARAGVAVPAVAVANPVAHGIVMVSGFFGALISLERAVALGRGWAFAAPPAAAFGALGIASGLPGAAWASLLAATLLTLGTVLLWRLQPSLFMAVMAGGAGSWAVAVVLDILGVPMDRQVPWLVAFLVGTIVGERLELSRLAPPSRWKQPFFVSTSATLVVGVVGSSIGIEPGWRIFGGGLLAAALWLAVFDVARRTIRMAGVTRFIAACLLSGYVWLGIGGLWWMIGGELAGTMSWDAAIHAVFVGFVLAMVFGHVHMVAPAVLGVSVPYRSWFAVHLVVLHASLSARVIGDLLGVGWLRRWGAVGNAVAIVIFLTATVAAVTIDRRRTVPGSREEQHHVVHAAR